MRKIISCLIIFSCLPHFAQENLPAGSPAEGTKAGKAGKINTDLVYKVNMPQKKADKVPVLIMLHGYGSNESDLFAIAGSFDERLITFSLRGPYAANGGEGYSWFDLSKDEKGKRKINYKEAIESRKKILSFISHACKEYKLDSTQVIVTGFSQGAIMCFDLACSAPQKFKAMMPLSGYLMQESKEQNPKEDALMKLNFFVAHGTQDNVIEPKMSQDAVAWFTAKKVPVTFKEYQMPHSINGKELNDMKEFIKKNLKPEKEKEGAKAPENKSK